MIKTMQSIFYSKKVNGSDPPSDPFPDEENNVNIDIPTSYTPEELNSIADEIIIELEGQSLQYKEYYNKCLEIYINKGYNTLFYNDEWNVLQEKIPYLYENQNINQSQVSSSNVSKVWMGTMNEYDSLESYDNNIVYFVTE